jgi:hypothetical protein
MGSEAILRLACTIYILLTRITNLICILHMLHNIHLQSDTCKKRDETREAVIESGRKLIENMAKTHDPQCRAKLRQEAMACFQRGLDVTHAMEKSVIAGLRKLDICCIVAPYEADVQLAYLCMIGYCNAVLTEGYYHYYFQIFLSAIIPFVCYTVYTHLHSHAYERFRPSGV